MNVDPISLVSTLVEAGNVDPMYRDLNASTVIVARKTEESS